MRFQPDSRWRSFSPVLTNLGEFAWTVPSCNHEAYQGASPHGPRSHGKGTLSFWHPAGSQRGARGARCASAGSTWQKVRTGAAIWIPEHSWIHLHNLNYLGGIPDSFHHGPDKRRFGRSCVRLPSGLDRNRCDLYNNGGAGFNGSHCGWPVPLGLDACPSTVS